MHFQFVPDLDLVATHGVANNRASADFCIEIAIIMVVQSTLLSQLKGPCQDLANASLGFSAVLFRNLKTHSTARKMGTMGQAGSSISVKSQSPDVGHDQLDWSVAQTKPSKPVSVFF